MAGFTIGGLGAAANGIPNPSTNEHRRQNRWVMSDLTIGNGGRVFPPEALIQLKTAERPKFKFSEAQRHHDQEVVYYAGKTEWEPVTMSWYDSEAPNVGQLIWEWFNAVVNFDAACANLPSSYKGRASLSMISGCAGGIGGSGSAPNASESWRFLNAWPKDVNYGKLDYTQYELLTVDVTLRYDRAQKVL